MRLRLEDEGNVPAGRWRREGLSSRSSKAAYYMPPSWSLTDYKSTLDTEDDFVRVRCQRWSRGTLTLGRSDGVPRGERQGKAGGMN